MNFSAVHGFNAYKQFTAQVREIVRVQETKQEQDAALTKSSYELSDPVDVVSISRTAHSRFATSRLQSQSKAPEQENPQTTLKEWIKTSGNSNSALGERVQSHVSGQTMAELLKFNGVSLEENEVYSIDMDVLCDVSVTEKNAEKAKAIQNLLNTTPSGINWGFLLQKLPVD